MSTNKYASARALNALEAERELERALELYDLAPELPPIASDETVPMLPALVRPQAE